MVGFIMFGTGRHMYFMLLLIAGATLGWIDQGITGVLSAVGILYGLKFLGKLL